MMTKHVVMAVAVALAGCGGTQAPPGDLDPALGGTWSGNTLVAVTGYTSTYPSQLVVETSGRTATISRICPDGSGAVVATGSGGAASWSGSLTCPPVAVSVCPAVTATLTSASGSLSADGTTLTALARGTASGCALTSAVALTFVGTR
jgi:hypothetical protein